jgi:hypothetical protein
MVKLSSCLFEEHNHEPEFCNRTHTGACDGHINFVDPQIFKLFRRYLFNCDGRFGANASAFKARTFLGHNNPR